MSEPLTAQHTITANDRIETGPGSTAVFAVGNSAFMVRQNSRVALESDTPTAVKALRVLSGAVASVWGQGRRPPDRCCPPPRPGIRGTGVYAEVFPDQDAAWLLLQLLRHRGPGGRQREPGEPIGPITRPSGPSPHPAMAGC